MHSPKFEQKAAEFKRIVAASVLANLWKKKRGVRDHMRKQIIPDAVEFLDFHMQHRQRCAALEALICSGDYIPAPILRMKVEKGKGLCRQIALPSPSEALILQALSDSLWREIKLKAPSPTAFFAPQDQPFSKLNPLHDEDEFGYGPIESWLDFQQEVLKFSQIRNYVVVTDIANYYDGILHSFLSAILSDYGLEREYALDLLLFILEAMLWRPDYMPNFGIGLPQMDLDAPRLLAHTHLFEVDELFEKDPDVDFARYMDDMDWARHAFLARVVASYYGLFRNTVHFSDFEAAVKRHGGPEGLSVFEFHENIATDKKSFYAAKAFIEPGNPSLPTGISHAKILMLATAMWNPNVPKSERAKLLGRHALAMKDTYYRQTLSWIISMAPP
jgi:hypothetical protein